MSDRSKTASALAEAAAELSREELADRWIRTAAEYENARKRHRKEVLSARADERATLLRAFAQLVDNLDRAAGAAELSREDLAQALDSIRAQGRAIMKEFSAEAFDPLGEEFDPARHEALEAVDLPGRREGEIAQVFEKGYRQDSGTILRPARVAVVRRAAGDGASA